MTDPVAALAAMPGEGIGANGDKSCFESEREGVRCWPCLARAIYTKAKSKTTIVIMIEDFAMQRAVIARLRAENAKFREACISTFNALWYEADEYNRVRGQDETRDILRAALAEEEKK